jgi:phenol 2-monooxygenase (NADPH)
MGAFGLNASILDSANLAWKIGLVARNIASLSALVPTFDRERRHHANRIIRVSGSYLRFVCNSELPIASFIHSSNIEDAEQLENDGAVKYTAGEEMDFLRDFFGANGKFLLGLDAAFSPNTIVSLPSSDRPIAPRNGVRAPNPRLCLGQAKTGYLYDVLTGAATLHIVLFASDLQGPIGRELAGFSHAFNSKQSFFQRYGAARVFNIVLVTKLLEYEAEPLLAAERLAPLKQIATVVYDDRAPDEDAHSCYGVDHTKGAALFIRPDLWIGTSAWLGDVASLDDFFKSWLLPVDQSKVHSEADSATTPQAAKSVDRLMGVYTNDLSDHMNGINRHANEVVVA